MMLALEIFFWIIIGAVVLCAVGVGIMMLLAKGMSDNASDNAPGPIERTFNRFMEWLSSILRHGKP